MQNSGPNSSDHVSRDQNLSSHKKNIRTITFYIMYTINETKSFKDEEQLKNKRK